MSKADDRRSGVGTLRAPFGSQRDCRCQQRCIFYRVRKATHDVQRIGDLFDARTCNGFHVSARNRRLRRTQPAGSPTPPVVFPVQTVCAATAAAEPLDDPPGVCSSPCGLRVAPGVKLASSAVTVLPKT